MSDYILYDTCTQTDNRKLHYIYKHVIKYIKVPIKAEIYVLLKLKAAPSGRCRCRWMASAFHKGFNKTLKEILSSSNKM